MAQVIRIGTLKCTCSAAVRTDRIAYVLYPMDILDEWIDPAAAHYDTTIAVVTGMDWQNVFSPWEAPGVPRGTEPFKGESPEFLKTLNGVVIPQIESALGMDASAARSLVGVSMSGLYTLWQWMLCDTFRNIACLSGSFWYEGFQAWMQRQPIPRKPGMAFFLLGLQEPHSNVPEFNTVGTNTEEIVRLLNNAGIRTRFDWVPGNHFADPLARLNKAFTVLYNPASII